MGRQQEAAAQLEDAARAVADFVRDCPESAWYAVAATEGWTVAAVAHHCAVANDLVLGWLCQMLTGRPVRETPSSHDASNAADSIRFSDVGKEEVLAALERTTARTAQFIHTLTEDELDRSARLGVAETEVTVAEIASTFAQHMRAHRDSLADARSRASRTQGILRSAADSDQLAPTASG